LFFLLICHLPSKEKFFPLIEFVQQKRLSPLVEIKETVLLDVDCVKEVSKDNWIGQISPITCDVHMRDQGLEIFKSLLPFVSRIILSRIIYNRLLPDKMNPQWNSCV
jgi:hypothetical protein